MEWRWWRWNKSEIAPRIKSKRDATPVSRIDLTALTPPADTLLAHAAAAQMVLATHLSAVAADASDAADADDLLMAQALVAARYQVIRRLLADYSDDPAALIAAAREGTRAQMARLLPDEWEERVATFFVAAGILRDFFRTLATAMPERLAEALHDAFSSEEDMRLCAGVIARHIQHDPQRLSTLSLWSRRVVGDTVLIARAALTPDPAGALPEERYEPLFSDIYTEHTRRLEELGLTA